MKKLICILPLIVPFNALSIYGLRPLDVFFALCVATILFSKNIYKNKHTVIVCSSVLFFILLSIFSSLFVPRYVFDLSQFKFVELLIFVFILSLIKFNNEDYLLIKKNIILGAFVISFGTLVQLAINPLMHRYAGFFIYSNGIDMSDVVSGFNELGAFLALSVVIAVQDLLKKFDVRLFCFSLLAVFAILMTKSRSSLIALGVALLLIFILSRTSLSKKISFFTLFFISIVYLQYSGIISFSRLTSSFDSGTFDNYTMMQRFVFWSKGYSSLFDNVNSFLFGYGVGGIMDAIGGTTTDNFYLDLLLRYGLLGFLSVLILYITPVLLNYNVKELLPIYMVISIVSISGNVLSDVAFGGAVFLMIYGFKNEKFD
ncbi:O-antigen ligase family protein [Vibrio cyclitrophicus]